ncbi:hypothetical protein [Streptomyces sp. NPDC058603]|uniref:hypothetical protein n=1 Tax=Streptomyces sp. NPDC058603 TaxID=3346551 RepID=UPI0036470B5F
MRGEGISRGRFLAGVAGVGDVVAAGVLPAAGAAWAEGGAARRRGLAYRGVCYAVGDGESPATGWMRADIRAVKEDLHASSVSVFGDGVERLAATASEAAERGLHVWLQPRLGDRPEREILEHLAETGRHAERLRRQGARVHLSVGCEFVLYVPGIVPDADVMERIENLLNGTFDPVRMTRRLSSFIARSAAVGRSVSGGPMTYGAAQEDDLDMASYSVVKTVRERPDDPASAWRWEPKRAFHALAGHYGRHAARR